MKVIYGESMHSDGYVPTSVDYGNGSLSFDDPVLSKRKQKVLRVYFFIQGYIFVNFFFIVHNLQNDQSKYLFLTET